LPPLSSRHDQVASVDPRAHLPDGDGDGDEIVALYQETAQWHTIVATDIRVPPGRACDRS